ncbi:hypothetical protein DNTS_017830 [Danionella cerebrum]|uniref:Uncharacterized protein n=1 Tax=Danionella cerebrum TaxID=2873325 RepID=A0A553R086_9TELE|nr:hypothetical protein DNTS_017830 [Danionella translucida]
MGTQGSPVKSYDYLLKFLLVGDSDVGKGEILDSLQDGSAESPYAYSSVLLFKTLPTVFAQEGRKALALNTELEPENTDDNYTIMPLSCPVAEPSAHTITQSGGGMLEEGSVMYLCLDVLPCLRARLLQEGEEQEIHPSASV